MTSIVQRSASAEGAFDQRLAELERSGRMFGLHALTVTRGGRIIFEHYGEGEDENWDGPLGRVTFDRTVMHEGKEVFGGGENSIAVFAIDQQTGEPKLIQHADPQSFHVRTFALDPSGRTMVAASILGRTIREGDTLKDVPTALSVFRVADDGRLTFQRKYDVETGGRYQFWMGIVPLRDEG